MNCRESQFREGRYPRHDGSACGPTDSEEECACGCDAYTELCALCYPPGEERIFGMSAIREAIVWAKGGGIAHHRNFDVDGLRIGGITRNGPAFHTLGLEPQLLVWAGKHRFPRSWMQPANGIFPPHFDVFGGIARRLVAQAQREGVDLT